MNGQHYLLKKQSAIWLGLCGVLGSLVLFAGDMLFYFRGDSTDFVLNMGMASSQNIIASGITALIAAWLYALGAGQVYYAFQPAKKWQRLTVFFAFLAVMIAYGVIHGAFIAIATSAKSAVELGMAANALVGLARDANDALRAVVYIPFAIFTCLFIPLVWMRKTLYPRWIVFLSPVVLLLLNDLIVENLHGQWKVIIGGGYFNLMLTVFFLASTIGLYKRPRNRAFSDH